MKDLEDRSNSLIHFVGEWPADESEQVLAYISDVEPIVTSDTPSIPGAKPWTMIYHDSFNPAIYFASRIGIPGVFRANKLADLIERINTSVDESECNERRQPT